MASYRVIFRACDRVGAVNKRPRPFGLDKPTLVKVSFLSLVAALEGRDHSIQVIGDRLSDDLLDFFGGVGVPVRNEELDNARSLSRSLDLAREAGDEEWIYLCEDDYLHDPHAFVYLDEFLHNREDYLRFAPRPRRHALRTGRLERRPVVVHLSDYPDRYRPKYRRASFVFVSAHCHWRQITHTTWTFLIQGREFRRREARIRRRAATVDDKGLSLDTYGDTWLRGRALCLSPIPGLATHMHEGTMSVLRDWEPLCTTYRHRIQSPSARAS